MAGETAAERIKQMQQSNFERQPDPDENKTVDENDEVTAGDKQGNLLARQVETRKPEVMDTAALNDARLAAEQKEMEKRQQERFEASPAEVAEQDYGRSVDRGLIRDSYEQDQYVRDGNVLFPAPVDRPVGTTPIQVAGALTFFRDTDEQVRAEASQNLEGGVSKDEVAQGQLELQQKNEGAFS